MAVGEDKLSIEWHWEEDNVEKWQQEVRNLYESGMQGKMAKSQIKQCT